MNILVTGAAGFIGFHLSSALLDLGYKVTGIDNMNDYYDPELKKMRLNKIKENKNSNNFKFIKCDISERAEIKKLFEENSFKIVINLAAQAGVRYSIENPYSYVDSNLVGFVNIAEGCRSSSVDHFIYASSSSVYGINTKQPFDAKDNVDFPISLYAATKKSNELIAHSYSHLYNIPSTGLRFFTVYGPYGRPDMAYFKFTKAIDQMKEIDVYNNGDMKRDFTYIDDIVDGILRVISSKPSALKNKNTNSSAKYNVYNIGNNNPVTLRDFISAIEKSLGKKAVERHLPMQPGDVPITYANIDPISHNLGFKPKIKIEEGIDRFVAWYKTTYPSI